MRSDSKICYFSQRVTLPELALALNAPLPHHQNLFSVVNESQHLFCRTVLLITQHNSMAA